MAGLVGRVAFRKILPGSARTHYPEDAVQNVARISPGPASAIVSSRWIRDKRLQYFPLLVGEVHVAVLLLLEGHRTDPLYPPFPIYEIASTSWEDYALNVAAGRQRDGRGRLWVFDHWSDGRAGTHTIKTPDVFRTYTAHFRRG
jgi:hypothetical protein